MIFIDLFGNPPPQELIDEGVELTTQLIALSLDERSDFIDKHSDYWGKLSVHYFNLSHGKCWYTEAKDSASIYHMDHFRPKKRIIELKEKNEDGNKEIVEIPLRNIKEIRAEIVGKGEDGHQENMKPPYTGIDKNFVDICKKLDKDSQKQKINQGSEYQCARKEVDNFVQGDRDRLLQLRSEAQKMGFSDEYTRNISWVSMIICTLTLLYMIIVEAAKVLTKLYAIPILLLAAFLLVFFALLGKDYTCIKRWRTYIMTAIEECDRELLDRSQNQTVSCNSSDAPNSPQNDIVDKKFLLKIRKLLK